MQVARLIEPIPRSAPVGKLAPDGCAPCSSNGIWTSARSSRCTSTTRRSAARCKACRRRVTAISANLPRELSHAEAALARGACRRRRAGCGQTAIRQPAQAARDKVLERLADRRRPGASPPRSRDAQYRSRSPSRQLAASAGRVPCSPQRLSQRTTRRARRIRKHARRRPAASPRSPRRRLDRRACRRKHVGRGADRSRHPQFDAGARLRRHCGEIRRGGEFRPYRHGAPRTAPPVRR
jgi:hypothetical protein